MGNILSHIRFYDFSELTGSRYETFFDSIDGWVSDVAGAGSINMAGGQVNIQGGTVPGDYAELQKFMSFGHWSPSFSKTRLIRTMIEFAFKSGGDEDNYFCTGDIPAVGDGFGFQFAATKIRGFSTYNSLTTYADLITGLTAPWTEVYLIDALYHPNARIEFKVDGVWKANIDTNLPIGDDFSGVPLRFRVGKGSVTAHNMSFSSALFFQDT